VIPLTAKEKRALVIAKAKPALGRNRYSQDAAKRECAFTPYKDGRYYSDCSSFVRWLYRLLSIALAVADYLNIGSNTESIINNKKGVEIECKIKNGVPTDISALRVGDLFLFRGTNRSRTRGVGHVEIVSAISGNNVTLMGHGSGNPKTHGMKTYCRARQLWLVPNSLKNRGLICVKRFIPDDPGDTNDRLRVTGNTVYVRTGPGILNRALGTVGKNATLVRNFKDTDGWYGVVYNHMNAYISKKHTEVLR
jgi:uncharacterized protein YgiM (DUF1202 family)